jgi:hypothetical protein
MTSYSIKYSIIFYKLNLLPVGGSGKIGGEMGGFQSYFFFAIFIKIKCIFLYIKSSLFLFLVLQLNIHLKKEKNSEH